MKKLLKHKKLIIILVILIFGATFFLAFSKNGKETIISANVTTLEQKTIEQIISVKAPLEGIEKAEVSSPLNYEIIDIKVKEGDIVTKDQVLAILDSETLQKEITIAQNEIELAKLEQQESLETMQIEYDKAILNLEELETKLIKSKELYEHGIITEDELSNQENSVATAKKALESYTIVDGKVVLESSKFKQLEIKEQALEQKLDDLEKVYIKSPIAGTVTRVNINLGRYANDTDGEKPMFVIENLDKLQMKVFISEFDIGKIALGQEAEIHSDILGESFVKGIVARISPTAEQKDSNNMERVIPVLIDVTEKPDQLIAGVLSTAKIKVDKAENVFAVPSGALIQDLEGALKLFVLNDDNTLKSIPVELGLETDLESEVKSPDLKAGMKVVMNPEETFVDGMAITPIENMDEQ